MEAGYDDVIFILLFIHQKINLDQICHELDIKTTQLKKLINKLITWGLVDISEDGISYKLTVTGENIIKYSDDTRSSNEQICIPNSDK